MPDTPAQGNPEPHNAPTLEQPVVGPVSSPTSTGGTGSTFEQHVGAYWLAQLLVGGIPPILVTSTVTEVSFQTERLGWNTDDFLVTCTTGRLVGQVKRGFTVSAADPECRKAISDFWKDFSGKLFSSGEDRLVLVTLRGTNALLEHFTGLLECARNARDGTEFEKRLGTKGLVSAAAVRYCGEIGKVVAEHEGRPVSTSDLWPFLVALHVLSLDLHSGTRQTEAHIKSMLALAVTDGEPSTSAAASWNELVIEASVAMTGSRSLRRDDLPAACLTRHSVISTKAQQVLQALAEHTGPVMKAIRLEIGGQLHLPRAAIVQEVLDGLGHAQIVLVAGPAGSGKSVIGSKAVESLASSHCRFAFRAEQFARAHVDESLSAAQIPANWATIRAVLGAHGRKLVLIESVERLLERTTRDAFTDFVSLCATDPTLQMVLTCRDYSVEQVRASILQPSGISHETVRVPLLNDAELDEAAATWPSIAAALQSQALRRILRNPFVLDRALSMQWTAGAQLPQTEYEFRRRFWDELVRGGPTTTPALGRMREGALETIAAKRARALTPYVASDGIDAAAVESLRRDSLIASPGEEPSLVAPAHDVIEDWAILQWLGRQHAAEVSFSELAEAIGPYPAVRRSYRKWATELVERDPVAADRLVGKALTETDVAQYFRDDSLVALLQAPSAPELLGRHEARLLEDGCSQLRRVIHLLRIACVKTPDWAARVGIVVNVPDGPAWLTVVRLVNRHRESFAESGRMLLLGLIEDAVSGVDWRSPNLDGATDVIGIAYWLLEDLRDYGNDEPRKRVLKVIAKLPLADPARFEQTLEGTPMEGTRRDVAAKDLRELVFLGHSGMPASRDLPAVVMRIGLEYILASASDLAAARRGGVRYDEIDLHFGVRSGLQHVSFPASGLRGPWMHLLRAHSADTLQFYMAVFNRSVEVYAHRRLPHPLEEAWEVELTFGDGSKVAQWANPRLWGLYRGLSVGPYILESMLMALESWLLAVGRDTPAQLDGLLIELLRGSKNAALTAVVASVATANPHNCGEAILALLSAPEFLIMDRERMASEGQLAAMEALLQQGQLDHEVYANERRTANALPHRKQDLEAAVLTLQVGPLRTRVQELLGQHQAALPPVEHQDDDDRLWRLALHRMDMRQYAVSGPVVLEGESGGEDGGKQTEYVRLDPKPADPDVQVLVDEGTSKLAALNERLRVLMWGIAAFNRKTGEYDPDLWASRIAEAQGMGREPERADGTSHAPGFVAAVCVRDRWDEMSSEQRAWCVDTVCTEVMRDATVADDAAVYRNSTWAADRAGAAVVLGLLARDLDADQRKRVEEAVAAAVTHPVGQVQSYALWSIDTAFWSEHPDLAIRCVDAIAMQAELIDGVRGSEEAVEYSQRRRTTDIVGEAAKEVRSQFWKSGGIPENAHSKLSTTDGFGASALKRILLVLGRVPLDPRAIAAFTKASNTLLEWWSSNDDRRGGVGRDYHREGDVSDRIEEFLFRTSETAAREVLAPLLGAVDRHPRDVASIMEGLTRLQDANPNTSHYWFLWSLVAEGVKGASWVAHLGTDRHQSGEGLLAAVFLATNWKPNAKHWSSLEGYAYQIDGLFESMPPTAIVLDCYTRFLYHVGMQSLPSAFVLVNRALIRGGPPRLLARSNTVFMLEVLLLRHVYGRPLELKRDPDVRQSVLSILDCLIENGSAAAYRMRDDFVTPAVA